MEKLLREKLKNNNSKRKGQRHLISWVEAMHIRTNKKQRRQIIKGELNYIVCKSVETLIKIINVENYIVWYSKTCEPILFMYKIEVEGLNFTIFKVFKFYNEGLMLKYFAQCVFISKYIQY